MKKKRREQRWSETSQECVQNATTSCAQSKRSNRDSRNREKQHNYDERTPVGNYKGANPLSNGGHGNATNAGE
eukprot:11823457-Heterocapsa_arctica.AAC.1